MKIVCLGPPYTFCEQATRALAAKMGISEVTPLPSAQSVTAYVYEHPENYGVIPYYNYLEGLVQECLDLIYEHHLYIIDSLRLPIELCFGTQNQSHEQPTVYSHPKALAQCSEYLWKHYPNFHQVSVASTAQGARMVAEHQKGSAIASYEALEHYGIRVIDKDIGNKKNGTLNFTDFYLLSAKKKNDIVSTAKYFTMVAIFPRIDYPGLLADILGQVAYYRLNSVKIHSRPAFDQRIMTENEPQIFYLEIMTHCTNPSFQRCMEALQYRLSSGRQKEDVIRVLGSYPKPS